MAGQQNLAGGAGSSRIKIQATSIEEGDLTGIYPEPLTLYNPLDVTKELIRLERSVEGFNGIVNTLNYLPRGRTSSTGWFLTTRKDIDDNLPLLSEGKLQGVSIKFEEVAEQLRVEGKQTRYKHEHDFTVENLIAIHAYAVTGIPEPPEKVGQPNIKGILTSQATNWENQLYVVQVVDWRYFNHLSSHVQRIYEGSYEDGVETTFGTESDESLNTRTRLWDETSTTDVYGYTPATTWDAALTSLWDTLPDKGTLGTGNANFPTENPWNRKYWGVSSWDAFNDLIGSINHVLVRDLAGNYELQDLAIHNDTTTKDERSDKESELISITNDVTGPSLPEKIRVVFPKLDYQFQTSSYADEVTPLDYWHNRPVWYLDIETNTIWDEEEIDEEANTISGTIHIIHSGMFAQWSHRSPTLGDAFPNAIDPAPDNYEELVTLATELATQYIFSRVDKDANSPYILEELYRGFIDFTPTKSLSSIVWAELGAGPITRIKNLSPSREGEMVRQPSMSRSGGGGSGAPSARYEVSASSSQRVANEFPGSPDHARLGEPSLRWAVVKLEEELNPNDHESAKVLYGTISGDGSTLVLGDCSKTITVHNISTDLVLKEDTVCLAYWHEQSRRWLVSPLGEGGEPKARLVCESDYPNRWVNAYPSAPTESLVDCISSMKLLSANKETYMDFKVNQGVENNEDDCAYDLPVETDVLLSLKGSPYEKSYQAGYPAGTPGAILWSNSVGHIRWTMKPNIGKYLEIGDGEDPSYAPFLRFGCGDQFAVNDTWTLMAREISSNQVEQTEAGIQIPVTNQLNTTVIVPNGLNNWSPGRHLTIESTSSVGNCVKLRWTAAGVFGIFEVYCREAGVPDWYTFDFDDGVVVGIYKTSQMPGQGGQGGGGGQGGAGMLIVTPRDDFHDADCSHPTVNNIHPCTEEYESPSSGEGP